MLTTNDLSNKLISELRAKEKELYSAEVQLFMERVADESNKQNFVKKRKQVNNYLQKLEKLNLQQFVDRLKTLEPELKKATKDLERELESLNNTIKFISSISAFTRVLAKFVSIF